MKRVNSIFLKDGFLLVFCFISIFIGDVLTKVFPSFLFSPSKIVKAFIILLLIFLSFKLNKKFFAYFAISVMVFFLGAIFISFQRLLINFSQFIEYYFIFFFFIAFSKKNSAFISKVLATIFLFHSLVIFLAFIFEIEFLKTYSAPDRFGYISFFNSQNEFSYIMISGVAFFAFFAIQKRTILSYLILVFFVFSSLLVGTKAIYLFVLLFVPIVFFKEIKLKLLLPTLALVLLFAFYVKDHIFNYLGRHFGLLVRLYENEGLISLLSSKRSVYFSDRFFTTKNEFTFINYLFGGNSIVNSYEMSFFELLFFLGIIGAILYIILAQKFIFKNFCFNYISRAYFFIVIGITLVAGYLIENASAQVYTLLTLMSMGNYWNISKETS